MMTTSSRRPVGLRRRRTGSSVDAAPARGFLEFPPWVIWLSVAFASAATLYDFYVSLTDPRPYMAFPSYAIGQLLLVAVLLLAPIRVAWSFAVALVALALSGWYFNFLAGYSIIVVMLFVLGVTLKRRWQLYFGVASVVWAMVLVAAGALDWASLSFFTAAALFTTGIGTVIGEFRARHNREVGELSALAEEARSRERRLLARELHDVVAHELTVITMQSHVMQAANRPEDVEAARSVISATAGNALGELKRLLAVMNDDTAMLRVDKADRLAEEAAVMAEQAVLADSGAAEGPLTGDVADLRPLISRLVAQLEAVGFTVRPEVAVGPNVPRSVQFAVGRLMREAVTNVLKYGDTEVPVQMRMVTEGGQFVVDVINGLPEVERATVSQTGLGLTGLAERVRLLGGHLVLTSEDRTWRLRADIPLEIEPDVESEAVPRE